MSVIATAAQVTSAIAVTLVFIGCQRSITIDDVAGTYQADVPAGRAVLIIEPGGTWRYSVSGKTQLLKSGKWVAEPAKTTRGAVAITLEGFEFGFPLNQFDPQRPGFWLAEFSYTPRGKLSTCIVDGTICFEKTPIGNSSMPPPFVSR